MLDSLRIGRRETEGGTLKYRKTPVMRMSGGDMEVKIVT